MYSLFLPFAAVLLDLATAFVYFRNDFWVAGVGTAFICLIPLLVVSSLLYLNKIKLQQATILLGFLHSGWQVLLQLTLLVRYWQQMNIVVFSYGTLDSPLYGVILVTCICSSLVVAKSARECHFLCQAPGKKLRVTASYFRASPFYLLHILYRGSAIGMIFSLFPPWSWELIIILPFILNMSILHFKFQLRRWQTMLSSVTSILTSSIFPVESPIDIQTLTNYQLINTNCTVGLYVVLAIIAHVGLGPSPACPPLTTSAAITGSTEDDFKATAIKCQQNWSLTYGFLPYIIGGGIIYTIIIYILMAVVEPTWLKLPSSSTQPILVDSVTPTFHESDHEDDPLSFDESDVLGKESKDNPKKVHLNEVVTSI